MSRKNKKDRRPFWTADAETDPFKPWQTVEDQRIPNAFIWGMFTGAGMHFFEDVPSLVEAIKDQDIILGFHNGGKFDFHVPDGKTRLLDYINRDEEMKIIDGRLVSAKIGRAEIRDTWNLFPAPLREFGSKLEIEYWKLESDVRAQHMPEIKRYLQQDCVGLFNAVEAFETKYGRHLTQAGASMAQWKAISGLDAPKSSADYFARFRDFYYGGRVQVFRKGYIKDRMEVRDIRSAYPRAMLDLHPYDTSYIEIDRPAKVEPQDMVTFWAVSNGALPWRNHKGAIIFPDDTMRRKYKVPGWEYLAALETGSIRDVELMHCYRFVNRENFSQYIHHFYNARKHYRHIGDDANAYFAKILMNSLYGKFGANPDNYGNFMCVAWEDRNNYADPECDHDGEWCRCYLFDGMLGRHAVVRRRLDAWQKNFINVATAASITSWVRAYLWRSLVTSDAPAYCDTDCIIARNFAPDMPLGEELGEWNVEGIASEAWIAGKKLYYLKGEFEKGKTEKMASKGVKRDADAIKSAALGQTVKVRSDAPTFSLRGKRPVYFQERTIRATA